MPAPVTRLAIPLPATFGRCTYEVEGKPCGRAFIVSNPKQVTCSVHAVARRSDLQRARTKRKREERRAA